MKTVDVECSFDSGGKVSVRRIAIDGEWIGVEQGRQWRDEAGLHVMVLLAGSRPAELLLARDALTWQLKEGSAPGVYVV
jgi:hypothetical protein